MLVLRVLIQANLRADAVFSCHRKLAKYYNVYISCESLLSFRLRFHTILEL